MPIGAVAGSALAGVAASAAGSLISGAMSSGAVSDATSTARADVQPWVTTGTSANTQAANLLGLNGTDAATNAMSTFTASPGYQYQVQQGLKAVDNGAAAKGILRSGATIKAEETLGSNLANQDFSKYYSRLTDLSTTGANAATGQAQTTTSGATQQSSIYGNTAQGLTNAVGLANKNGLFSSGSSGLGTDSSVFGGAGSSTLTFY